MKIKCNYCSASFDDYLAECPYCGAPNEGIVRTVSDQPLTIEQLAQWYKSKGLPPYETTRFFIGIDYKEPRAFGIYKEPDTGKVVVYKNKDNGERAIRYQGTDEAYGVNELYQRLKQEIIQQKMNNVQKKSSGSGTNASMTVSSAVSGVWYVLRKVLLQVIAIIGGAIGMIVLAGAILLAFTPQDGYYDYNGNYYYYNDLGYDDLYVFAYDKGRGEWNEPVEKSEDPGIFTKKSKCKKYFLSSEYDPSYECTDINDSQVYQDYVALMSIDSGYYAANGGYYYHYGSNYESDWYYYDNDDWSSISVSSLPAELSHASTVDDFYYTPDWDSSTQISDFTDSDEYTSNYASSSSDDDGDDSSYSWDSSDSWDSGGSDWSSDW